MPVTEADRRGQDSRVEQERRHREADQRRLEKTMREHREKQAREKAAKAKAKKGKSAFQRAKEFAEGAATSIFGLGTGKQVKKAGGVFERAAGKLEDK